MRKLKIIKCSDENKWYFGMTGRIFTIVRIREDHYSVHGPNGSIAIIAKSDATPTYLLNARVK